jgi:GTPase Era involved in 16S rRNA processing
VSSIREISLERDRIVGELKHYKELCNILSFSLNTSEQALKETQPHVVDKLVEGRTKRILALEKINKERKKDIDQRSAETCAVSSTHLESFSVKAQTKYDAAEEVTKDSLKLMSDIFRTASIEMPIYISKKK